MTLTIQQAIAQLNQWNQAGTPASNAQLDHLLSQLSVRLSGPTSTVLYSGRLGPGNSSLKTEELALAMARQSGGKIGIINDTDAARVISSNEFQLAIGRANAGIPTAIENRLFSVPGGVWDTTSARFANELSGPVVSVVPFNDVTRSWSQTELRQILNNTSIPSVNGITRTSLLQQFNSLAASKGDAAAFGEMRNHLMNKSFLDGITSDLRISADGTAVSIGERFFRSNGIADVGALSAPSGVSMSRYINSYGGIGRDTFNRIRASADWLLDLNGSGAKYIGNTVGSAVKYLGPVGDILDGALSAARAYELFQSGNPQGAFAELAGFAGGLAGGFWAGGTGIAIAGMLGLSGPVGWGLAAALAIGGGLGGEALARWGANGLADLYNGLGGWLSGVDTNFVDALRNQLRRFIDPIVIDLDGNGIELNARVTSSVYFDMDADGIKEHTGWVKPTDGLLSIDSNSNGQIDNINELIGDLGRSGFGELISYDLNNDKVINGSDSIWNQLRVWIDSNSNALTEAGELRTLASLQIRSIDLRFTAVNFTAEGNRIHEQSIFEYLNGTTGLVADIWFDASNVGSDSSVGLTGNLSIDNLPDIRGRGDVRSLRAVMLEDAALATLVTGLITQPLSNLLTARSQVEQIIYRWAGVQSVDRSSRGGLFDAQKLAALEAFLGTPFLVQGDRNPNAQAVASLTASWNGLVDGISSRLLMSGPLGTAVDGAVVYAPEIDRLLSFQTPAELLTAFSHQAPRGDGLTTAAYWAAVLPLVREIIQDSGGDPTSTSVTALLSNTLLGTGLSPFSDLLNNGIVSLTPTSLSPQPIGAFRLSFENDALWLNQERHAIYASDGHDFIAVVLSSAESQLIDGGSGNDQLYGGSSDDWIDGGTGADTMAGGGGNDTYSVDDAGDVLVEASGAGEDHVRSSITYTLANDLEHLTLLGSAAIHAVGNGFSNRISGNSAANRLEGLAGHDTLDGGAGADTMIGGLGYDLYRIDDLGDVIIETGTDTDVVEAAVNYTLAARIENLALIGSALNGTGNALNNRITGNSLNNLLDGGIGSDQMEAGLGDDIYVVDNGNDWVGEVENAGIDTVRTAISYSLGTHVEHLQLLGSLDLNGNGNTGNNHISGNAGDNRLDGGSGVDTMVGGAGADTYIVDNVADVILETSSVDIDTVETSLPSYTLAANVDHLQLFVGWNDSANRNGTGNHLPNVISGSNGINIIAGLDGDDRLMGNLGNDSLLGGNGNDWLDGGLGDDRLEGGAGDDRYVVNSALDVVIEVGSAGADMVESSISYILGMNVENLLLTGGSWDAIDGQGNSLNNFLSGNSANNNLDGGAGADTMAGGGGNDTYTVDHGGDAVVEVSGAGEDHVRSTVNYTLANDLEHLTLLGTAVIHGVGNGYANRMLGNSAANRLEGFAGNDSLDGGAGADTMLGGLGADLYRVDDVGDVIIETGTDTDVVEASASHTLGSRIENLVLIGTALNGTGNALNNRLVGNALNNLLNGGIGSDQMEGGLGNDTYIVDSGYDWISELADAGIDTVRSAISYSLVSNVENLQLTGLLDLNGSGNTSDNHLTGNAGDNRLNGGSGADTMIGGAGADTYIVDNQADVVIEAVSVDIDSVETNLLAYTLAANLENLQLFVGWNDVANRNGTGNNLSNVISGSNGINILAGLDGDDQLFGNTGNDSLFGGNGHDWLDGGLGDDRLEGGAGDDRYVVNSALDVVVEVASPGVDMVESSVSHVLSDNVENLLLTGNYWDAIDGQGNSLNNLLSGNNGSNNLDGAAGADTMVGGSGNDIYTVDDVGDLVVEASGAGEDHVRSTVNYTLANDLEHLTLLGTAVINAVGNSLPNRIIGNSAVNRLESFAGNDTLDGGAGADTMIGGYGADLYRVDDLGDVIIEIGAETDLVEASVNHTLGNRVENLVLLGSALNAVGNALDNRLIGNALNNLLDGANGNDQMEGGLGDDTYIVDSGYDWISELVNAGIDTVRSAISFSLGSNFENLQLTGSLDINGSGNTGDNHLTGNSGDNRLDGGSGVDTMIGGAGADTYIVDNLADVVIEAVSVDIDTVETNLLAYTLAANVKNLQLFVGWNDSTHRNGTGNNLSNVISGSNGINILTGLDGDDQLFGNTGNDSLFGGNGHDWLDGGLGDDRLEGGAGDDRYVVNSALDVVVEVAMPGVDLVESSVSYILGANVENLLLTGSYWEALDGQGNSLNNLLSGNNGSNNLDGAAGADTLAGGGGNDTYTVDHAGDLVVEASGAGEDHVRSTINYTLASDLEHLTLLGTAVINGVGNGFPNRMIGNSAANRLESFAGNDTLDGGAGTDTMIGGLGADLYRVDEIGDVIIETGADTDVVEASVNYALGARIENLVLIGSALHGTGNALDNRLIGNALNNLLDGGIGNDQMEGGLGDDTYIVDSGSDWLSEVANAGIDTVRSAISYSLGSQFENLQLTGLLDINGTGNTANNHISGNASDNRLDGGSGVDTMIGGAGADTYVVDHLADVVIETASTDIDTVETSLPAYTLATNVENLQVFVGWKDAVHRNATGNNLSNVIQGNDGINNLSGLDGDDQLFGYSGNDSLMGGNGNDFLDGGLGDDRLEGGAGDDRYSVNSAVDVVIETASSGTDTVESSIAYVLGANLENLRLIGDSWNAIDGQGNSLNNVLSGTSANNNLDGGTGADTMAGAGGNDTYSVDNIGDVVVEWQASGNDHVRASIGYTLGAFLENLTLLGTENLTATGNRAANSISGNIGNNTLIGGLGVDTLSGAAGADVFQFFHPSESGSSQWYADEITDFRVSDADLIDLSSIDAIESSSGNESFTYIGSSQFTAAGQIRSFSAGTMTYVALNINEDISTTEMMIAVSGSQSLQASSFIL